MSGDVYLTVADARRVLGANLHIRSELQALLLQEMIDAGLLERVNKQRLVVRCGGLN